MVFVLTGTLQASSESDEGGEQTPLTKSLKSVASVHTVPPSPRAKGTSQVYVGLSFTSFGTSLVMPPLFLLQSCSAQNLIMGLWKITVSAPMFLSQQWH